jgi:hypothetical protein
MTSYVPGWLALRSIAPVVELSARPLNGVEKVPAEAPVPSVAVRVPVEPAQPAFA